MATSSCEITNERIIASERDINHALWNLDKMFHHMNNLEGLLTVEQMKDLGIYFDKESLRITLGNVCRKLSEIILHNSHRMEVRRILERNSSATSTNER